MTAAAAAAATTAAEAERTLTTSDCTRAPFAELESDAAADGLPLPSRSRSPRDDRKHWRRMAREGEGKELAAGKLRGTRYHIPSLASFA